MKHTPELKYSKETFTLMYEALLTVMSYWHKDQYEAVVKAAIAKAEGRQP
jgi:hypothetical protein